MLVISDEAKKEMRYAKDFCVTEKNFVFFSGKSASIFDKEFRLLSKITGLNYVYSGAISPDEQHLLLLGQEDKFYTVSLDDFTMQKHRLPRPYCKELFGRGCFAFSGNGFLLAPRHETENLGVIREFSSIAADGFTDYLGGKYRFYYLSRLQSLGKYIAIGDDVEDYKWYLFFWRDDKIERYEVKGFDDALMEVSINEQQNTILLIGAEGTHLCDFQGNKVVNTNESVAKDRISAFVEKHLSDEIICFFEVSKENDDIVYLGTPFALLMVQMTDGRILKKKKIDYGVHRIYELEIGMLLISTWSGIKLIDFR